MFYFKHSIYYSYSFHKYETKHGILYILTLIHMHMHAARIHVHACTQSTNLYGWTVPIRDLETLGYILSCIALQLFLGKCNYFNCFNHVISHMYVHAICETVYKWIPLLIT